MKQLLVTLVKSPIGCPKNQRETVKALGLGKIGSSCVKNDNEQIRGMIKTVAHLVSVKEA